MILTKPTVSTTTVWERAGKGNEPVVMIVLQNGDITLECTNIGCSIVAIHTPDRHQVKKNIVAGFKNWELYTVNKDYLGCVVGRFANRIAHGTFNLNGKKHQLTVNDWPNHLHGGWNGFSRKVWQLTGTIENEYECGVEFTYASPDGEEGYPGNVLATVQYKLNAGKKVGTYNTSKLWHLTDKSDIIFLKYWAETPESVSNSIENHISQTILSNSD